jgi:type 1 glutamine amidotransferase
VTVLATVDESTYTGGTMGADHPIAWTHPTPGGGRAFYTAMGHTITSYAEPLFRAHLAGAIRWVAGR